MLRSRMLSLSYTNFLANGGVGFVRTVHEIPLFALNQFNALTIQYKSMPLDLKYGTIAGIQTGFEGIYNDDQ